ncbi:AMP-binding protein [Microbacterium excoecariae]|uniref:AMP-binding protein n=1 Tax=Microbacterium excoecariae TaxID=2715210 RepID=UPI00140E9666|nr:AMP-binding protein [Microbacterium excoecariae]NHI16048.1 AMP-binding protein [Microbacterium excoecariae]
MSATESYRAARDQLLALSGDHARAAAEFSWPEVGPTFNWAVDWFDQIADDRPALVIVEEDGSELTRSYAELSRESDVVADWLAERGVAAGEPVMLMLGNQVEMWVAMLAIMKLGAVILPTTTAIGAEDLADRVTRGGVRCVIANARDTGLFAGIPGSWIRISVGTADGWTDLAGAAGRAWAPRPHPGTAASAPLLRYFTSGTTSRPKLVEHSQVSYPVGHLSTTYWIGVRPGDVHLNISSPGWGKHAWSSFFAPWIAEATIFVYNYQRFDAAKLLQELRARDVATFCGPPTVWRMLIHADLGERPAGLRELVSAGEPLNPEVIQRVERAWGLTIRDGFGQTETTAQIGNTPGSDLKPGSMGRPLPGYPVALLDTVTGERIEGPGEGELCLDLSRPVLPLMTGYWGDEERTAEATRGGYYRTGDIAARDADGFITYVGRTDDVFKASDYKISPFELESALIAHPAVSEAAVVPAPDPLRLAVPKAYIALAPGHEPTAETARDILAHARAHLAPYLRVRRVEFFDLPKTISGKIRRVELRAREEDPHLDRSGEFRDDQFPGLRSRP